MSGNIRITSSNATISSDQSKYTLALNDANLRNTEVALGSCFLYNSWASISSGFANNVIKYVFPDDNTVENTINIDTGVYSFEELSDFINYQQYLNGHYLVDSNGENKYFLTLSTNHVIYGCTLNVTPVPSSLGTYTNPAGFTLPASDECPRLVVPANTTSNGITYGIGVLLGFAAGTYPSTAVSTAIGYNSTLIPEAHPVSSVSIKCNIANSGFYTIDDSIIKTFAPTVGVGELIQVEDFNPVWYECRNATFNEVDIQFVDQLGRALQIRDTQGLIVNLLVRPKAT